MCEAAVKNRKLKTENQKQKIENRKRKIKNKKLKTEKISELEFGIIPKTGSLFMAVYFSREVQQLVQLHMIWQRRLAGNKNERSEK